MGTPLAAERAALSSAQVLLVRIVSGLGTVAIAANSLGVSAEGLCYMAGYGIQDASIASSGRPSAPTAGTWRSGSPGSAP